MKDSFDRYHFQNLPFDVAGYDSLIQHVMKRSDFPKQAKTIEEIHAYLIDNPIRVVVFGSYHRGYNLIEAITGKSTLEDAFRSARTLEDIVNIKKFQPMGMFPFLKLVGVVTDDPDQNFVSKDKRIWRYEGALQERDKVLDKVIALNAKGESIALTKNRVKTPEFNNFIQELEPDIALMGTFGQLIDQERIDLFPGGFLNFHPIGNPQWTHVMDSGPQPFEEMIKRGESRCWMAMHQVDTGFDSGRIMGLSSFVKVPEGATPTLMHKISSPLVRETLMGYFSEVMYRMSHTIDATPRGVEMLARHRPGVFIVN